MHDSTLYWLRANYRKIESQVVPAQDMAFDISVSKILRKIMEHLTSQWVKRFDKRAEDIAEDFVRRADHHTQANLKDALKKSGFTVKFNPSQSVREAAQLSINENVQLIKSIPQQYMAEVNTLVMQSAMAGRDLGTLSSELQKRYGISRRRAALIARDQNNKATATINRKRQMDLGLKEAIWIHSTAGKYPRPSHVKAGNDKLRFRLDEGALIDGERIFPGEAINCRCYWRTIIPGFDE
ncbi:phage head morphogenesis protein [Swingsia samuiensis]|uniref:Phage head morphogenesis protein n=2 Tax=Swingsia samuiensis TaxID=1293412 RepID=A0A4Y6UMN7_9PROT|nr:phage head morphogenesis protein [Swingsia samuiensis]